MDRYFTGLFTCVHVLLSASFHSFNYRQILYLFINLFIYLFIYLFFLFIGQSFEGQKGLFGRLCYLTNVLAIFAFDEYP